jgi:hypothetical protein
MGEAKAFTSRPGCKRGRRQERDWNPKLPFEGMLPMT